MSRPSAINEEFTDAFVLWLYKWQFCMGKHVSALAGLSRALRESKNDYALIGPFIETLSIPGYRWPLIVLSKKGRRHARSLDDSLPNWQLFSPERIEPSLFPHELYLRSIVSGLHNGLAAEPDRALRQNGYARVPDALLESDAYEFERTAKNRSRVFMVLQKCAATMRHHDIEHWYWYFSNQKVYDAYTSRFNEDYWPEYIPNDKERWRSTGDYIEPTDQYRSRFTFILDRSL